MLLCSVRQLGSIYKAYLAFWFVLVLAPSLHRSFHFVTSHIKRALIETYSVSSRARTSNRYLRAGGLNPENALEVLRSSSVFTTQWLHRFEGA